MKFSQPEQAENSNLVTVNYCKIYRFSLNQKGLNGSQLFKFFSKT